MTQTLWMAERGVNFKVSAFKISRRGFAHLSHLTKILPQLLYVFSSTLCNVPHIQWGEAAPWEVSSHVNLPPTSTCIALCPASSTGCLNTACALQCCGLGTGRCSNWCFNQTVLQSVVVSLCCTSPRVQQQPWIHQSTSHASALWCCSWCFWQCTSKLSCWPAQFLPLAIQGHLRAAEGVIIAPPGCLSWLIPVQGRCKGSRRWGGSSPCSPACSCQWAHRPCHSQSSPHCTGSWQCQGLYSCTGPSGEGREKELHPADGRECSENTATNLLPHTVGNFWLTDSDSSTGDEGWKHLLQKSHRKLHNKVTLETFCVLREVDTWVWGGSELTGHSLSSCKAFPLHSKYSLKRRTTSPVWMSGMESMIEGRPLSGKDLLCTQCHPIFLYMAQCLLLTAGSNLLWDLTLWQ